MPKLNKDSTLNITFVGIGLCLLCSAIISIIAIQLRSIQENNVVLDMQKKIVSSAGLTTVYGSVENAMSNIKTMIIDLDKGEVVDISPDSYELAKELREEGKYKFLSAENDIASIKKREKFSKVYIEYKDGKINTLILPVRGYGLWGILYGYLAIEGDFNTVAGLEFYEHKETPGLGDKIDLRVSDWILSFTGKKVTEDNLSSWRVRKDGGQFDQFTGATITPRAVVKAVKKTVEFVNQNREQILLQSSDCGGNSE